MSHHQDRGGTQVVQGFDLWRDVDRVVQSELAALDGQVLAMVPGASVRPGWNKARAWLLFSYRVFDPPADSGVDPVVVGVNVSAPSADAGTLSVHGDACGETLGDVLLDFPPEMAADPASAAAAAREVARRLAAQAGQFIVRALQDVARQQQ